MPNTGNEKREETENFCECEPTPNDTHPSGKHNEAGNCIQKKLYKYKNKYILIEVAM